MNIHVHGVHAMWQMHNMDSEGEVYMADILLFYECE